MTNELPKQHVEAVFARYGADYDKITIYGNVEFYMQQMCANMTAEEVYVDKFDQLDERMHAMLAAAQQAQHEPGCERDCAVVQPPTGIRILRVKVFKPQATNSRITEDFKARAEHAAATKAHVSAQAAILEQNKRQLVEQRGGLQRQEADVQARLAREKDENEAKMQRELAAKRADEQLQRVDLAMRQAHAAAEANVTLIHAQARASALLSEGEASANVTVMEARANERLHTDAHVRIREAEAVTSGAKYFYFGKDVPKTFFHGVDSLLRPG